MLNQNISMTHLLNYAEQRASKASPYDILIPMGRGVPLVARMLNNLYNYVQLTRINNINNIYINLKLNNKM